MNRYILSLFLLPGLLPLFWVGEETASVRPLVSAPPFTLADTVPPFPTASPTLEWIDPARAENYPFLRQELNQIENEYASLRHFYELLYQLEVGLRRTVNIVHIGDSHLQADWFSGHVRMALHRRFGSAGRGLIFPYKLASTNSPTDIIVQSNIRWDSRRNVSNTGTLPIGISGVTAKTNYRDFLLRIALGENPYHLDYRFNKITLFTDKGPRNYDLSLSKEGLTSSPAMVSNGQNALYHTVQAGDNLTLIARKYQVSVAEIQHLNRLDGTQINIQQRLLIHPGLQMPRTQAVQVPGSAGEMATVRLSSHSLEPFASTVYLNERVDQVAFQGQQHVPTQVQTTLYGLVLENFEQKGILYHMIGVNGAQFHHYTEAEYFFPQLRELKPDLIILSLGTNESHNTAFRREAFFREVDDFTHKLESEVPLAEVLVTTPADAFRSGQVNANVGTAREVLFQYALQNGHSVWDFYTIMGGEQSIQRWYESGLAQKDRLHLTRDGYILQARLLYDALIKGYGEYLANR